MPPKSRRRGGAARTGASPLRVVLVGAGSANFGRPTLVDLLTRDELRAIDLEVWLVDVDAEAAARMLKIGHMLKEHFKSPARIRATTDRREALPGARYVIVAVAQKRFALWEQDFRVPLAFGFRHVDGENGGPGAAFHTLRSLHQVIPLCKDMEKLCPDALLINFTNPESRVILGVSRLTSIKSVGLCHGAFSTLHFVAETLGRPVDRTTISIGGINHFHWVLGVQSVPDGKDLTGQFYAALGKKLDTLAPAVRTMVKLFGLLPFPAPAHIAEYVSWGYEMCGMLWPQGNEGRKVGGDWINYRRSVEMEADRIRRVAEGKEPLSEHMTRGSAELAVPIICDVEFDTGARELSVNIPNCGAIPNLPDHAIVEIPARVDRRGVHGEKVGPLPEPIAAMCRTQITIQDLLVEAYRDRSKHALLQALVLDPVVDSVERAERMMNLLLEVEADYLPQLA
jgi:alpha-galactosidase